MFAGAATDGRNGKVPVAVQAAECSSYGFRHIGVGAKRMTNSGLLNIFSIMSVLQVFLRRLRIVATLSSHSSTQTLTLTCIGLNDCIQWQSNPPHNSFAMDWLERML